MKHYETPRLNEAPDVGKSFKQSDILNFQADHMPGFDEQAMQGELLWKRTSRKARFAFNQYDFFQEDTPAWEFPVEYPENPAMPFKLSFVSSRTVRIQIETRKKVAEEPESLMIPGEIGEDASWRMSKSKGGYVWKNEHGSVELELSPFHLKFKDKDGRLLTQTQHHQDTYSLHNMYPVPFSFVRSLTDMSHRLAATFTLSPGERVYGTGESYMGLNKRGQRIDLWTRDALSNQTGDMYKPVPFVMSSRGYGMFFHTSAAVTMDIGQEFDAANSVYVDDDCLDLFFFFGDPKQVLEAYTNLTGKSPMPPLWSFGLWMSRITYESEAEAREVAAKLRELQIPCDVIHLDTGWFEEDWRCDYEFAKSRFDDPQKMIDDLKAQGFKISLWQIPYFTPNNKYFNELIEQGLVVTDGEGNLPTMDAILDFSNPATVAWYQDKIGKLMKMGVGAIKADFGEGAPIYGRYHSGQSGRKEHNLYPLRYNKAVADVTKEVTGDRIIWARSAWAGSQRYPVHWSGDVENTDNGMLASLRSGLSLGLCGFSFWSHDIGGFVKESPEALYRRWMPYGMLTSHSRCHGYPPKEPWAYSESFMKDFRAAAEMKYKLIPYIYTQAYLSSQNGYPLMRTLFFERPEDPTCWMVEDQYFLGSDLLVAPLFEEVNERPVYLPADKWIDYQTGEVHEGNGWVDMKAGDIPIIVLVKAGATIAHAELSQSLQMADWDSVRMITYTEEGPAEGAGEWFHPLKQEWVAVGK